MTHYFIYYLEGQVHASISDMPEGSYQIGTADVDLEELVDLLDILQSAIDTTLIALSQKADKIQQDRELAAKLQLSEITNKKKSIN